MYKLDNNCWKCEEVKLSKYQVLYSKLPEELVKKQFVKSFGYEKCKSCERNLFLNHHSKEYFEDFKGYKDHYWTRQTIRKLLFRFLDDWSCDDVELAILTRRDYREIIKQSNHPLTKQMLKYITKMKRGQFKNSVNLLNYMLCYDYKERDFPNLSRSFTGEDTEIVKAIFLVLLAFLQTYTKDKYHTTQQEIQEFLNDRMK